MSINKFFQETLGANLRNPRWSWGAIDPASNRVFLRVWKDQIRPDEGGEKVQIYWKNSRRNSPGRTERREHLVAVKNGAQGIGVVCIARDPLTDGKTRQIAEFEKGSLLQLGDFTEDSAGIYAHITARISVDELARLQTAHSTLTKDLRTILSKKEITSTSKEALINARVGQGAFRSSVLRLWDGCCAVTGSVVLDAIRASHIKPWRDSTNEERLDPMNGLPLVASLDALFDAGLISFDDLGHMLVAPKLSGRELDIYCLVGKKLTKKPRSETVAYLRHHRTTVFMKL